ncbi:peptidase M1-like protein [Nonlabens xylanidelens]|uniref:Peptidase M1-like protein n=1 Tax=Nonlabens xylanidelens TaxID=191564 RepID=A0A2S6IQY3_9FLAO|nr:M1 family metallopeptidase [Nonlabens xylanidelens]PPK96649.1 peptidase M1-like protein [Nonlabens xylanidelens]PQJ13365.1 peptidase M1 [Nonlabens xylanidelens]
MKKIALILTAAIALAGCSSSKNVVSSQDASSGTYWQQHVNYDMDVNMDVDRYQYTGKQKLVYTNNSPETLDRVYYHLFFNAFQPGSEMDVRSRTIADPDRRVGSRIAALEPNEIGYLHVSNMTQDGQAVLADEEGTVLVVKLAKSLAPGESTTLELDFNGQVPVQVRRSGRNNKEGVALSMTQWYPKMAEFDKYGWNTSPYIGREFHGVWGDFDVELTIDKDYTVGGTGYLQNPKEIGHGYDKANSGPAKSKDGKLKWHFKAPQVHDFAWGADKDFIHDIYKGANGVDLHFFYKDNEAIKENWKKLQPKTNEFLKYFNEHVGDYPYKQYSVIQGGDGGMEYAMCTLITGERSFGSLAGVTAHEFAHSWFNHILATNESKDEWMDEGFTTYISNYAMNAVFNEGKENPNSGSYRGYIGLANSGKEQPQTTHADRYAYNAAYGTTAYSKGAVFMAQLGYVVGDDVRDDIIKEYYNTWKFKHPDPNDFKRVAERVSGFDLEWYLRDWTMTTNTIDYSVENMSTLDGVDVITFKRNGLMPMPLDVEVTMNDGSKKMYYIPLSEMRGEKKVARNVTTVADWAWAYPTYDLELDGVDMKNIRSVTIDPKGMMADVNKENNTWQLEE